MATLLLAAALPSTQVQAASIEPDAGTGEESSQLPLPALPKFIDRPVPKATPQELSRLDALLAELSAPEASAREAALQRLKQVDGSWLPALVERFERVASDANKLALKQLLERLREQARAEQRAALQAQGKSGAPVTPDYLQLLTEASHARASRDLKMLIEVVAYSRMFEQIGSLPAARRLVQVYVRFGEFLRVDTQLALARLGDRAVAALLEATGHPVVRIADWARDQLEELGRAQPGDALQVADPALRADVLRAYGRLRPLEVLPLLVSYASSDVAVLRVAARESLTRYGEAAAWALRDGYERTLGERAPASWSWQRVARELFARFDRQQRADVFAAFERGLAAQRSGDTLGACAAFDQVLLREPEFEHGPSLAEAYLRCAAAQADGDAQGALLAASRAERLEPAGPTHARAASLRQTLEAEALLGRGLVDRSLIERARQLDPQNQRAQRLLERVGAEPRWNLAPWRRYLGAFAIVLLSALGLGWMLLRRRLGEG
jgi:hypothetical protein